MDGDSSDTSLALGLGRGNPDVHGREREKVIKFHVLFPPKKSESEKRKSEELSEEEEEEMEDEGDNRNGRKKLKLTLEQSSLLEQSFREQRTLSPNQKQILAKQLNLLPRQVEVWFQNRRARTKLKQIELNCQLLKNCCERLSEENRRLKKELQELKGLRMTTSPTQFYINFPSAAASLTLCPYCQKTGAKEKESPKS
ncbi:homeobox-leucine zipper protein HOX15-like [Nymphaea colorata]|nr:homeobox-leucine zipper protein HOX15-like [Nymphaea colorata]